ncbi:MAG TPA: metallophosphoesterase [Dissulfurispiraceae bacterium]|nr:metallophosphoesterase [Dissulfurispiraceae bacterium]
MITLHRRLPVIAFLKKRRRLVPGIVIAALIILYSVLIEPFDIEIHRVRIHDSSLARVLGHRVVVQLSDLHIDSIGHREQKVLDILETLQPDIIFLTGDYVTWRGNYEGALDFLSRLKAKQGVWAVMGDYDYSNSRKSCLFCHEKESREPTARHEVRFLQNSRELLAVGEGEIRITGIDWNPEPDVQPPDVDLSGIGSLPDIVLSHSPLVFDFVPDNRHVFVLAGDTHGGQVPLPGWVFGLLGYPKNARYNEGVFTRGKKTMFVSRGIGTSHLQLRLFRKPEVVVLQFVDGN